MDKLFRKRTARKAEKQKRKPAPLPKVPPSLNVDIRNSLILPGLSERFSLLLPGMSAVTEDSVRDLLAQQRARGLGPALTEEEEELVLAELRDRHQQQQQQEQLEKEKSESRNDLPYASIVNRNNSTASVSTGFTGYTDWDGNPPSFDSHDWQSSHTARVGGHGMANSISGTSLRSDGTHLSPSGSVQGLPSSGSHHSLRQFHKERVQARSYGFTGSASFRDNNYLRQVQKAKANVDTIDETDSHTNGSLRSPSTNGHALPTHHEQNGNASPNPSSNGSMPTANSFSDIFHSANDSASPQTGNASIHGHDSTSPFSQKSNLPPNAADRTSEHSSKSPASSADRGLPEFRSVPQSDDEGAPREVYPSNRSSQRQSVLMSMNPQQMKRVSLALLEIETHLGRQLSQSEKDQTEADLSDEEREEILDGDDENDRVQSPVRASSQQTPLAEQSTMQTPTQPQHQHQHHQQQQQPVMLDRQNSSASTTSSVFPFTASPASSAHVSRVGTSETRASIITNDNGGDATPTIGSLPSSPRTLDFQRHLSSHSSHASHGSQSHHTSSSHSPHHTHNPMPSTSSVGTEIDGAEVIPQPVLKPYRPQPVRATPTPVLGSSSGYVPGQPRPVGRANGGNSISSIGSAAAPLAALSPIGSPNSGGRSSHDGPARPQHNAPASSQQLSRAISAQSNKSQSQSQQQSRARTPSSTRSYVPPPGVLSSRQQQQNGHGKNHSKNHSIHSLTESIGAGTVSPHLGKSKQLHEPNGHGPADTEYLDEPETSDADRTPEPNNARSPSYASSTLPSTSHNRGPPSTSNDDDLTPPPSLAELAAPSSIRSYGRTASMNSFSSNFNSPDLDSNSPWDAIVNAEKSPLDSMQYWAQSEQDRNQLDLLKSISGIDKEDLAMIQANLVQKAKEEGAEDESPITEPSTEGSPWTPYGGPNIDDSTEHIPIPPSFMNVTDLPKGPPPPRPPPPSESPSITIPTSPPPSSFMHGRNPSSQVHSPIDVGSPHRGSPMLHGRNLSSQVQSPSEMGGSMRGPPSSAHGRGPSSQVQSPSEFGGSSALGHERVTSNAQTEKSADSGHGTLDHSRTISASRKWLDDDPNKRRDIEERIRGATSDLFRAPSRSAHKRNLSKKQIRAIGTPTLLSTSHNVPCNPIVSSINKENEGPKPKSVDKKMSMRWRKLSSFKKPSATDLPPPPPNPPSMLRPAKVPSPEPPSTAVVQLKSKHEVKKEQYRAKTGDSVAPDLAEFKFPRAPSTTPNGQSSSDSPSPEKSTGQSLPNHDRPTSGSTQRTQRTTTRDSQASQSTSAAKIRSPSSSISQQTPPATRAPSAAQRFPATPNDFAPVEPEHEEDTMRPYSRQRGHSRQASDASVAISTFMEAGRTLGIDENRLSNMLQQTGVYEGGRPGTGMSMRSRTHSRSNTPSFPMTSPPLSPSAGRFGSMSSAANGPWRIPSPVAEDKQEQRERERERHLSNNSSRPQVVRRTIVMPEDADDSFYRPSMDSLYRPSMDGLVRPSIDGYGRPSTPPLQLQRAETNQTVDSGMSSPRGMVRGNSIRRKPVQWNSGDQELMAHSPPTHRRNFSEASEAEEELHFPPPINFDSPGGTRSARSSMGPSTNGSIYDYYQNSYPGGDRDSMVRDSMVGGQRASQAVEITEYSDGRVIWNVVNALRNGEPGGRESMASVTESLASDGSNYAPGGGERDEELPWRIGPTERLDFIRRPETRVFYTSSADVGDLIDQLSSDLAGASHGRIDIRPSSPRTGQWDDVPEPSPAGLPLTYANMPVRGSSLRYPVPDSPRASSFATTSEEGGERTVEDRLQALMDRLKAAPGGVGRAPSRTAA